MSDFWLVNGWRQQSCATRDVDRYLRQARERGFHNYALVRQGRWYWLACSADATLTQQFDLALTVRRTFAKLYQGIYLALWQGQVVCVAWQGERLQHCVACQHDADGLHHIELLVQRIASNGKGQPSVLFAKQTPADIVNLCERHLCQWRLLFEQCTVKELQPPRAAKLKSLQLAPPWQQRQRVLAVCLVLMLAAAAVGWYLWPTSTTPVTATSVVRKLSPPAGVEIDLLNQLPQLFAGFQHLAGWQWRSAQLQGEQLQAILVPSFGRAEELRVQLPAGWELHDQGPQVLLKHSRSAKRLAVKGASQTLSWLDTSQRYFPSLAIQSGTPGQNTTYRWQQWQLRLPATDLLELARLASLLQQSNLRITSLRMQNGSRLQAELTIRLYQLLPISHGERTS
ncbi:hypothetical protein ACQ5ES_04550 [Pseudidiomarina sp. E22-M8]|uniref:hypothetical protein n=1 Tax=Pseudidiomarina sp. E22-M8 TaxID=3424768 RepID=UPI00403C3D59